MWPIPKLEVARDISGGVRPIRKRLETHNLAHDPSAFLVGISHSSVAQKIEYPDFPQGPVSRGVDAFAGGDPYFRYRTVALSRHELACAGGTLVEEEGPEGHTSLLTGCSL